MRMYKLAYTNKDGDKELYAVCLNKKGVLENVEVLIDRGEERIEIEPCNFSGEED